MVKLTTYSLYCHYKSVGNVTVTIRKRRYVIGLVNCIGIGATKLGIFCINVFKNDDFHVYYNRLNRFGSSDHSLIVNAGIMGPILYQIKLKTIFMLC